MQIYHITASKGKEHFIGANWPNTLILVRPPSSRGWGWDRGWGVGSRFFWREKSSWGNYHFPVELVDGRAAHFSLEGLITSQCLGKELNRFPRFSHP